MSENNHPSDNFAGFVLVVGIVSIAFGAVFQLTFEGAIALLLNAVVLGVGSISIVIGLALDAVGYFDEDMDSKKDVDKETTNKEDNIQTGDNKPLPPVINFDGELRKIQEFYDGDLPDQFVEFRKQYEKLKSTEPENRESLASDLRTSVNPLSVLAEDTSIEDDVEDIGNRLFTYIKGSSTELLEVENWGLYENGNKVSVSDVQGEKVRIKAKVKNNGEAAKAELYIQFISPEDVKVRDSYLPIGEILQGDKKDLDTSVYVPSVATKANVTAVASAEGEEVLDM